MNQGKVVAFGTSLLGEALVVELDDIVVLGMDDHDAVVLRHLLHRKLDASDIDPERNPLRMRREDVGGKHFEAWEALLDHVAKLIKRLERLRTHQADVE